MALLQREKRVRKANPDSRECQASGRKANLESQGPGGNLEKMAKRGKGGVRASLATPDTQGSRASQATRETKVKLVLLAHQGLS